MQNLVLIPGLASDAAVWQRTVAAFEGKARCIVLEPRVDRSLREMAQEHMRNAPERFALAGVSMGGMIALEMMRIAPERVSCLALVDTSAQPDTLRQKLYRRFSNLMVTHFNYQNLAAFSTRSMVHSSAGPEIEAELVAMAVRVGVETYILQNHAVMARPDLRPYLKNISIPTAVVVGAEDRMTPVALSREMHDLISESTLHILDGCGHLPPIEKPERMAEILSALFQRAKA